jgi:DNA mismatch repair protein MutL
MSDIIKLLPDSLANQIAAGEVVQRPASAVKELLENALDAGATQIKLIIKDAGKTLIQVVDNGSGMSETDARMCFERHATSKITTVDDLFKLHTFGFRGEAMASIAAVAQVSMRTRPANQELGTHLVIEGSVVRVQESCQTAVGTNISVKNLFYNVPARRQFLKADPIENRHIIDEFQHVALANPDVHFSLFNNEVEVFDLPPAPLRKRIVGIFGNTYNDKLVPVEESSIDFLKINGFVGKSDSARKTRGEQFFFVNDRFIRSSYLNHAVATAYDELLSAKTFPFYVLFLDIDPQRIDVNVHPTKQEIKFDDEKAIYALLHAAVRRALSKNSITPSLDFDQDPIITAVFQQTNQPKAPLPLPNFEQLSKKNEEQPTFGQGFNREKNAVPRNWKDIYTIMEQHNVQNSDFDTEQNNEQNNQQQLPETSTITIQSNFANQATLLPTDADNAPSAPYQLHRQYIVSQIQSGFMLIDQQAAHERILFEKYTQQLENAHRSTQQLLFPKTLELPRADAELLKQLLPDIIALGYDIQEFGQNSFVLHGIPADLTHADANEQRSIEQLLEQYQQQAADLKLDRRTLLARSMAYNRCIKKGQTLSPTEMEVLIDQLFACQTPYITPNSRPTFITYSLNDIEKQFK